jgi:hypothetical protein
MGALGVTGAISATRLGSAGLGGAHRHAAVLIDFNDVTSASAAAAESAPESLAALGDDRVGVGVSLNPEALPNLLLEEGIERVRAVSERIDFSGHWRP